MQSKNRSCYQTLDSNTEGKDIGLHANDTITTPTFEITNPSPGNLLFDSQYEDYSQFSKTRIEISKASSFKSLKLSLMAGVVCTSTTLRRDKEDVTLGFISERLIPVQESETLVCQFFGFLCSPTPQARYSNHRHLRPATANRITR